ncbi:hypothetical protein AWC11_04460 [Mycobacterium interjectum]|nr:hypothetical protein AWC11_04460 [Mycobacterium interjectum]
MDWATVAADVPAHHLASGWQYVAIPFSFLVFAALIGNFVYLVVNALRPHRGPAFAGPALAGTAQVLSARGAIYFGGRSTVYRVGLRVAIPGHPPYDTKVTTRVEMGAIAAVQPGATVAVQVDSSDPKKVRIDLGQPAPPPAAWAGSAPPAGVVGYGGHAPSGATPPGSPMSPAIRLYIRILWLLIGLGFIAALVTLVIVLAVR